MKNFLTLLFLASSVLCLAQADADQPITLNPESSRIIGGSFSFQGQENLSNLRLLNNSHQIRVSPYFSLKRTEKQDLLLQTSFLWQNSDGSTQAERFNNFSASIGVSWRNQLYAFGKFKVFGSYGPRIGGELQSLRQNENLGFNLAATGAVSLAYELAPNFRLLTSVFSGIIQYRHFDQNLSTFSYSVSNSLLSPNFSIEYILPRRR